MSWNNLPPAPPAAPPTQIGPPPPVPPRPGWTRKRVLVPAATVVFLVGLGIGSSGGDSGEAEASGKPRPIATVTESVGPKNAAPAPTVTKTVTETVTVKPKEPAKPKVATIPGDGTYVVGDDIEPGTYKTAGPDQDSIVPNCYYARLKDTSGDFEGIIANANTQGQTTVTIQASDGAFETTGCQEWVKTG